MTTAARPTWAPAKGGNEQGGTSIFGPSQKFSSRDLAAHTSLKPRYSLSLSPTSLCDLYLFVEPSRPRCIDSLTCPVCSFMDAFFFFVPITITNLFIGWAPGFSIWFPTPRLERLPSVRCYHEIVAMVWPPCTPVSNLGLQNFALARPNCQVQDA